MRIRKIFVDCNQSVAELSLDTQNIAIAPLGVDSRVRTVKFLFAPHDHMWGYPEMSIKITDVPRMGYSAYDAKGFESYEISTRPSLFVPVG